MRLLVICLTMGLLLWQTSQSDSPNLLTLVGFMTATGLTLSRFCKGFGLPALSGALIGGVLLGKAHIIPIEFLPRTHHFNDFALGWTGLFMGAGITPKILANMRLVKGSLCLYFPPTAAILAFFVFQGTPLSTALPIALLAGTSVILFWPPNAKNIGEIIPLAKLTTGLGLLLWMPLTLNLSSIWPTHPWEEILTDAALFIVLLEATAQICKHAKSETAQHLTFISLAYLLTLATGGREISTFYFAFPAGIYLSFRNTQRPLLHTQALSDAIVSFVLIFFALEVFLASTPITTYHHTLTLGFYFATLIASKVMGGLLAQRLFHFPPQAWLALLPQGFVVFFCLNQTPSTLFSPSGTLHITVLISFIVLSLIYPISTILWSKIKKDPLASHRPTRRVF